MAQARKGRDRAKRLCVVGTGYVGLATAVAYASHGRHVECVDILPERVRALQSGKAPFFEPGLEDALRRLVKRGTITATTDLDSAVAGAEASFICVGTPSAADGSFDMSQVEAASRGIGDALLKADVKGHIVVTKSTLAPSANRNLVLPALESASRLLAPKQLSLACNPEFLREGAALADALKPDRIVIGTMEGDARAWTFLSSLYRPFKRPVLRTSLEGAELVKLASNALLATKVAFANEVANLAAEVGADGRDVLKGVGMDHRLGPDFLQAGPGFGGSCFPKDLRALIAFGQSREMRLIVPKAALAQNEWQPLVVVNLARRAVGGDIAGRRVALLGLAFKADTDDVRETRALPIYRALTASGAEVVCHDPRAGAAFAALARAENLTPPKIAKKPEDALRRSDVAIIQADWPEYRRLSPQRFRQLMAKGAAVVDGRRILDPEKVRKAGLRYYGVGWPSG